MAGISQDQPRFLLKKAEDQILLFGVRKVLYQWALCKVWLETAGFWLLHQQQLQPHLESILYLRINRILRMVPSRLTSISMVKDRKSLLMIDFLPSNYLQTIFQINYLVPLLLHKVHGGQSFLKKQQQNFLRTMMESLVETLLMLLEF